MTDEPAAHAMGVDQPWILALRWSGRLLVAASWLSGVIFAAYILLFFGATVLRDDGSRWNEALPGLFDPRTVIATTAIGLHFVAGGALLLLGPVQFIGRLRRSVPALHRWLGWLYVSSAGLAGIGGLAFILDRGTIGGQLMDVGFGLYGILMVGCAATTFVHARAGRYDRHRAWATRLFALTVGSWLYRMEYSVWYFLVDASGGGAARGGWLDAAMAFMFYIPNLLVAEVLIRARHGERGLVITVGAAALNAVASALVILATWSYTAYVWGPGVLRGLTPVPGP